MRFTPWLDFVRSRPFAGTTHRLNRRRSKQTPRILAEMLEARTLLTAPQFVSVSPNVGDFLQDGDVRTEAPGEFVFQFSPGQSINPNSVGAVHVVGAGYDGEFTPANTVTDLGTNGAVLLRLGARRLGPQDNGATLTVLTANNGGNGPQITTDTAGNLTLTLDSNVGNPTTAARLIEFATTSLVARQLLTVSLLSGDPSTVLSAPPATPLPLSGAGAASAISSFGVAGLNVQFTANQPGESGNNITLHINRLNLGAASAAPRVTVTGQRIDVTLNENATTPTTAQSLINAINGNQQSGLLLTARLATGLGTASLAGATDGNVIRLSGADRVLTASASFGFQTTGINQAVLQFAARQQGLDGNNVALVFQRQNLSPTNRSPLITVAGTVITVTLNSNSSAATRASELIAALTANAAANALVSAKLVSGLPTADLSTVTAGTTLALGGADSAISPGFRGRLPSNHEVVYRFGAPLTSDLYQLEVIGTGTAPLTNLTNEPVNGGQDSFQTLTLDLGTVVTSVIPQPVLREQVLTVANVAKITDGDTITVDPGTGSGLFVFEFNDIATQPAGAVRPGNLAIDINKSTATTATVATAIAAAVNSATLANPDVTATASTSTVTFVGGSFDVRLRLNLADATLPAAITQRAGNLATQLSNQIHVYFSQDDLIDTSAVAENPVFYQLIDTKGTAGTGDDTISLPTSVDYDTTSDRAVLTFATIPTGTYQLKVGNSLDVGNTTANAVNLGTLFAGSGYTTTAFTGDGGASDLDLYRLNLGTVGDLTVTVTPDSLTSHDTTIRLLNSSGTLVGTAVLTNNGPSLADTLSHAGLAAGTYFVEVSSSGSTRGSYRIDISTTALSPLTFTNPQQLTPDDNSSYASATDLGVLGVAGKTLSAQIEAQSFVAIPEWIGASDEPGHRADISGVEGTHGGSLGAPAFPAGIQIKYYNFGENYGFLFGSPLINQITEGQKARVREMFELWSRDNGVQFVETANQGIQIVVGDPRAVDPTLPLGVSVSAGSLVVISHATYLSDEAYGGGLMGVMLHEVGHSLGMGHTGDLHAFMNGGGGQPGYPGETLYGDHDLLYLRRLYPLFASDIDLYKFTVSEAGTFSASVSAELASSTSLLDSALTLFRDPHARANSDFNTAGAVSMTFQSDSAGAVGNDIQLVLNQNALANGGIPSVSVNGHTITVTLDTTTPTTATQLKTALDGNAAAALLIDTNITGAGATAVTGLANGAVLPLTGGNREVIARNDDYNSNDAFLSITLEPGTYYVGVTSTGNADYDPTISDSGYGGRTDGAYDLQINFAPIIAQTTLQEAVTSDTQTTVDVVDPTLLPRGDGLPSTVDFAIRVGSELMAVTHVDGNTLTVQRGIDGTTATTHAAGLAVINANVSALLDADGNGDSDTPADAQITSFDGNNDGLPGGDFEFWFQSGTTVFIDKATTVSPGSQNGTLSAPYSTISAGLNRAATRIVAPTRGAAEILDGDIFTLTDGTNPTRVFEFDRTDGVAGVVGSNITISIDPTDTANIIATKIANAINTQRGLGRLLTSAVATGDHVDLTNLVSLDVKGTNGLLNSPNLARIAANGGVDGTLATEADATPYLVGVDNFGATLIDGRTFDVPQGVTLTIDAGTVIKFQTANIDVGTDPDAIGPNRQDGALQLLGTPKKSGTENNAVFLTTFRNDLIGGNSDGASAGAVPGQWGGVILRRDSDMNDSDVGDQDGGDFFLNSIYQANISYGGGAAPTVFSSIHIVDERPTIAYSRISNSAEAAISANPNAFDDSLERIGPDIHGNTLTANSVNGLLVRIEASVNGPVDKLDVRGRFDDTDVTHVISEQLQITGNAGGAVVANEIQQLDVQGTPIGGTFTLTSSGGVTASSTSLNTPITAAQTTFAVGNAALLPGGASFVQPFNIRVTSVNGTEEMRVFNKVGNTLTVQRGVNGTTAVAHTTASPVARSRITIPLSNVATAAEIQLALDHIDGTSGFLGFDGGNVRVSGGPLTQAPINIEFINRMGSSSQAGRLSVQNAPAGEVALQEGNVILQTVAVGGVLAARPGGRLQIDPGVVVKLSDARIEGERGSSQLIAEGTDAFPVIFTSLQDDRFGAGGTFDTSSNGFNTFSGNTPAKADWGGLFFGQNSNISVDRSYIAYGGGNVAIAGGNANFAAIEAHEADLRLANTTFEFNASGADGSARNFRTGNVASVVFVRGAQPTILDNTFYNNDGAVISIDANAMRDVNIKDPGRSTGAADIYTAFNNNRGPLVRLNRLENDQPGFSGTLGMQVRAAELTTQSTWDDTDIVHVVTGGIFSLDNKHSLGGLRLQSAPDASLVVKLGTGAGFSIGEADKNNNDILDAPADDGPLEITDRIGGTMQIVGAPGFPVILTSIHDDSVGASLDTAGFPQTDTNGNGTASTPAAGNWGEILFDKYAHDRNVSVHLELEKQLTAGIDTNSRLISVLDNTAEDLGNLAPDNKSSNENRRAGFQVHGTIAYDDPGDVDIYKFVANAGTEIWLDTDFTDPALDTIVEFVSANGTLLARSQGPQGVTDLTSNGVTALPLQKAVNLGGDFYTTTIRDAGMRLVTPGVAGTTNTYFVRIRSNPATGNTNDLSGGLTSGAYQFQVRLGQRDETPGVSVKFADIRYATNGIHVKGLPYHSPLLAESTELGTSDVANNVASPTQSQLLGNLMFSDRGSFGVGGAMSSETDIDFYKFHIDATKIQEITGINGGPQTWPVVIDIDWADGLSRPDSTIAIFNQSLQLIYLGRESNVADDQPSPGQGSDVDDLARGSVGKQDPFIGSAMFEEATAADQFYYLAVVNNQLQPAALSANILSSSTQATRARLEPVTSIQRIAEDHIGFQGYSSNGTPVTPVTGPLLDITDEVSLASHVPDFDFSDVVLFVSQDNQLRTVNPLTGAVMTTFGVGLSGGNNSTRDIAMSSDGLLFGYQNVNNTNNTVGRLVRIDTGTAGVTVIGNDNISGESPTPSSQNPTNQLTGTAGGNDFDDITTSDSVDAFTIERTGVSGGLPTYAGWYSVNENGLDVAGNVTVNSKLYRANLTTGAIANGGGDSGFGDIQYTGVGYASGTAFVTDGTNTVIIFSQAKAPGAAGEGLVFTLINTGANNSNIAISFPGGGVSVSIGRNVTAQQVVDAVNQNGTARRYLTLSIANGGNGGIAPGTSGGAGGGTLTGGVDDPTNGVLRGNVTGLSFDTAQPNNSGGNLLYGVTDAGELISIDRRTPSTSSSLRMTATLLTDWLNSTNANIITARGVGFTGFTALTLGPQNLHDGLMQNTLFATTNTGRMIAFEIGGPDDGVTLVNVFGSDNETQTLASAATSGTFTLSYTYPLTGEVLTTVPLDFDATASEVSTALRGLVTTEGLFPFLAADINVTGGPLNMTGIDIEFQGFYTDKPVNDLVLDATNLNNLAFAFESITGGDGVRETPFIQLAGGGATGLAFSNLDFNLWHPTFRRGDTGIDSVGASDLGHGINYAFDNSRNPDNPETSSQIIQGRTQTESVGGASFYFGVEQFQGGTTPYLNYQAAGSQYGIVNDEFHRDITANVLHNALGLSNPIANNYNLPGGSYGTLITNPISLAGYVSADKPTLYFNYLLASQNASAATGSTAMRDSARVFASTDGGRTWSLLATNNTVLTAELPEFIAHSIDYNESPVQELFDTANWRQARVDLSGFATESSVQFRFDFSTAGKINEAGLPSEEFGVFDNTDGSNADAAQRGQSNNFEGFYIDDIIVGFAERGELVTGASADLATFDNLYSPFAAGRADINNKQEPPTIIATGAYQVEIRKGTVYASHSDRKDPTGPIGVFQTFDTNDRMIETLSSASPPIVESFDQPADFPDFVTDASLTSGPGSAADWSVSTLGAFPAGGSAPNAFQSGMIAAGQRSGAQVTVDRAAGQSISFTFSVDAAAPTNFLALNTFNSLQFLIDGVAQPWVISGNTLPGLFPNDFPGTGTATPGFVSTSFIIPDGGSQVTFEWRYIKGSNALSSGSDAAYIDNLVIPLPPSSTNPRIGDRNVDREQGMVILEGNFIRNVSGTGIIIEPGDRDSGAGFSTNLPYGGSARQTPVLNDLRLVTHAALVNNVITNFGTSGIRISGDTNAGNVPDASVPLVKVINNTIYGGGTATNGTSIAGTGIVINNNSSPTLMNNIIANTIIGIDSTGNSTSPQAADITTTLFQNNAAPGTVGNSAIVNAGNASPLFVNAAAGNFYLAPGQPLNANEAIDASLNQRFARTGYTAVTNPLGIPAQDQFSPDIDRFGQLRIDDPGTPNALGIFRDLGGIERTDFSGPVAGLITPLDNGAGVDLDPVLTSVAIENPGLLTQFVVKLLDVDISGRNGVGVNDTLAGLITGSAFTLTQTDINGSQVLFENVDYTYAYNANTNEAIFTSVTVFPSEARYNITINAALVQDIAGNILQPNQLDGSTQFNILVTDGDNDPPTIAVPTVAAINENTISAPTSLILSAATNAVITVADPDAFISTNEVRITLTATEGTITLPSDFLSQVTLADGDDIDLLVDGDGTNDAVVTFIGTIPIINQLFANTVDVLELSDNFESGVFDPLTWFSTTTTTVDGLALNEPSGVFSAHFDGVTGGGDTLTSVGLNLSTALGGRLSYAYQRTGSGTTPGAGEDLIVEYSTNGSAWVELERQLGGGLAMSSFARRTVSLPTAALSATTQIRFRNLAGIGLGDDWFVDDVSLTSVRSAPGTPLTFVPTLNFNSTLGVVQLNVLVNDLGNFSADIPPNEQTTSQNIVIQVNPVNTVPTVTVPATVNTNEDTDFIFSGTVSVSDAADGDFGTQQVTLTVTDGTLTLASLSGLDFSFTPDSQGTPAGNGLDDISMTFRGTLADINNALNGLEYDPDLNFNGTSTLTVVINDLGNTGAGMALTATDTTDIVVTAVNDAPVNLFNSSSTFPAVPLDALERTAFVFNTANSTLPEIQDVDVNDDVVLPGVVVVTLTSRSSVTNTATGTLTLSTVSNLTFDAGANDSDSMTIRGTIGDVNNALNGLVVVPSNGFTTLTSGEFLRVRIQSSDEGRTGTGGTLTDSDFVDLDIREVNDPPTIITPGSVAPFDEEGSLTLGGANAFVIGDSSLDPDPIAAAAIFQVTLAASHGVLTLNGITGLDFAFTADADGTAAGTGTDDRTLTFRGTVSAINTALDGLLYEPDPHFNTGLGSEEITITVNDRGHSGEGGSKTATSSVGLTIQATNDDPAITAPGTVNATEDSKFDIDALTLTGGNLVSISDPLDGPNTGTYTVTLDVDPGLGSVAGTLKLGKSTAVTNDETSNVTIVGTIDEINAILGKLQFMPPGGESIPDQKITITVNDGGNVDIDNTPEGIATANITVVIDGDNDAPVITIPSTTVTLAEDQLAIFSTNNGNLVSISDIDDNGKDLTLTLTSSSGTVSFGQVTIQSAIDNTTNPVTFSVDDISNLPTLPFVLRIDAEDLEVTQVIGTTLTANRAFNGTTIAAHAIRSIGYERPTGITITAIANGITATGTKAALNAALDGLTLDPPADNVLAIDLSISVNDNGNTGKVFEEKIDTEKITISYTPTNDAPVVFVQGTQVFGVHSPALQAKEDTELVMSTANLNGISFDDVDLLSGQPIVTLVATNGTLTLSRLTGLTITAGGNGTSSMTFSGTARSAINTALDGMKYTPTAGFNGSAKLTITIDDQGNTGDGGPQTTKAEIPITVAAVNDAPVVTSPTASQSIVEDNNLVFSAANGNSIILSDVDINEGTGEIRVNLGVTGGTLTLGSTNNITFDSGTKNGSASLVVRGPINDVNLALNGLVYAPTLNVSGKDTLTITANDLGNFESPIRALDSATKTVNITITSDNDAPTIALPSGLSTGEETKLDLIGGSKIQIADVDAGTTPITLKLETTHGALGISSLGAATVTSGALGSGSVTLSGVLGDLNSALSGLSFTPTAEFNGTAKVTVTVNDGGATGTVGGAKSTSSTLDITVTAINDAPVGVADSYAVLRSGVLTVTDVDGNATTTQVDNGVLANDTDVDSSRSGWIATLIDAPDFHDGTFTLNANGTFTYTHNGTAVLSDSFTYRLSDGTTNATADTTVTITINDPPQITNAGTVTVDENSVGGALVVDLNASDANGNKVSFSIVSGNTNGAFSIDANTGEIKVANAAALNFESTPSFSLVVQASDDAATPGSSTATVTVNLNDKAEAITIGSTVWTDAGITLRQGKLGDAATLRVVTTGTNADMFETHVLANLTSVTINARNNASDGLTVDFSAGSPIPAGGLSYSGGTGTGSDSLLLVNGVGFSDIRHTFTSASSGSVAVVGSTTSTISYINLEPIVDDLGAASRTFIFGGSADNVTLNDVDAIGNSISRISAPGTAETVDFRVPTTSLTVKLEGGNDTLTGTSIDDAFVGTVSIEGGDGADIVDMAGFDSPTNIDGGRGADVLSGGSAGDFILGGEDNDILDGRGGNDNLLGAGGSDTLTGGSGTNSLNGQGTSFDVVRDAVSGTVTLANGALSSSVGSNTLLNIEKAELTGSSLADNISLAGWLLGNVLVNAGDGDDSITGSVGRDTINGEGGNDFVAANDGDDVVSGGLGADILSGDNGNDALFGDAGNDQLYGGAGNDTMTGAAGADIIIGNGGSGDQLTESISGSIVVAGNSTLTSATAVINAETDTVRTIEKMLILGSSGNDNIDLRNWYGTSVISAGAGNDSIRGGFGFDQIFAGAGDDRIESGASADIVYGEDGDDRIDAGDGNDFVNGNAGNDSIKGGSGNDKLFGDIGNDVILGGTGDDSVAGQAGSDTLLGEAGNDIVRGDTASGANAPDRLAGGGNGNARSGGDLLLFELLSPDVIDDAFSVAFNIFD